MMQHTTTPSLNQMARSATIHCLTGCGIGEIVGMVIGTAAQLSNHTTVIISIVLAFFFGYLLTTIPLLRSGFALKTALVLAFASDTISIAIMEVVDNAVMLLIPGAMAASLGDPKFWLSLFLSLGLAGLAAFPVVRFLIARGKGHAVVHDARPGNSNAQHHHH